MAVVRPIRYIYVTGFPFENSLAHCIFDKTSKNGLAFEISMDGWMDRRMHGWMDGTQASLSDCLEV